MQETQEMWVRPLGWEDPLEEEMATHSRMLTWEIPLHTFASVPVHSWKRVADRMHTFSVSAAPT